MGAVYLAQQSRPRRIVAVKVLLPHLIDARPREEFLARFRREADAIAALDHINIMPIYEYGEQREAAYLVMPYVTGGTLRERLEVQPIPPVQHVVSVIEQVAAGLESAHALGIIHRDLKPGNILFHADGRVLITDFGLAKILKDAAEQDSGAHALTSAGSIIGTPEYLSPEQGTGNPTDYRTDIYSLGVLLYQMLAGRVPFMGTTPVAVAIKHALQEPPLITQFNPAIPHSVEAVAMKALAKAPEQRFTSAGELARTLRLAIANESAATSWRAPGAKLPSVPTIPATDAPKLTGPAKEQEAQEKELQSKELQSTERSKSTTEEEDRTDDQDTGKKAALEAKPINQTPQEETRSEKVAALPTLLMGSDGDELHNAPTWEGPPTGKQDEAGPASPPVVSPTEVTQEDKFEIQALRQEVELPAFLPGTEQPQHSPALAQNRFEKTTQQPPPVPLAPGQRSQARLQPIWKMLIGGFLILLIIVGGLTAYTHLLPTSSTPGRGATATAISNATSTPPPQGQTPTAIPPLAVIPSAIPAGAQLYGTSKPFSCDKQGGHWTSTSDVHPNCNSGGSQIANTSGHLVVANLEQLPTNQAPWSGQNFVVQVQVTINPNSHGTFGINFQSDNNSQEHFAYLLDPPDNWTFNHYNAQNMNTVISGRLLSSVSTQLTIDIRVEGTNYKFYVNGRDTTGVAQTGPQYINKIVGLAVDANANVTFSNFAVYAL
jgi:serine/threonine protein kinase